MEFVFKLLTQDEWTQYKQYHFFAGSVVDQRDGFIHLSYGAQLKGTAERHFAGRGPLVLVAFARHRFGPDLKDEISRGGMLFPHLYRALQFSDMLWHRPILPSPDGVPIIPEPLGPAVA